MPSTKLKPKTKTPTPSPSTIPAPWLATGGVLGAVALVAFGFWYFRAPPQMGADPEVFHTVDALYTAVRKHDDKRLEKCAERLAHYRAAGQLPDAPAAHLDAIIARARTGDWDTATRRLYDFMLAQRREGERHSKHEARKKAG